MKTENFLLLGQIAEAFSALAFNPAFEGKGHDVGVIAGLVGLAFDQAAIADVDRRVLLAQIEQANAARRGLTDQQKAQWRERNATAKGIIENWRPSES